MKLTNRYLTALVTLCILSVSTLRAQTSTSDIHRQRISLDSDWRFLLGDPSDAQKPDFEDAAWSVINVPHDWSIAGSFDKNAPAGGGGGYLPTGIGWYRKVFQSPSNNHRTNVEFDGIYENSEVWINGHSLGKRPFGYASFVYDVTPYLNADGAKNVLAVRVDNSPQPNSRWYSGSGIYRHTWLLVTDDLHILQWGTFIQTPEISATSATAQVAVEVQNNDKSDQQFQMNYSVLDDKGATIATSTRAGNAPAGETNVLKQSIQIANPILWSNDKPYLYILRCTLMNGSAMIDQYDTPFGIRTLRFDVNKGFLLNGVSVKLNGVCLHGDGGGVGTAVPEGVWARRLQLLKDMGCNAIRTSHNPPAPEFLDLCDKMGFLVMDEAFDEWVQGKRQNAYHLHFKEWWKRDLTDFIRRDRNHPSVILWSAGNEIGEQGEQSGIPIVKELVDTFHSEDPTRPVTAACDRMYAEPTSALPEFAALLDVVGYNYVDRWRDLTNTYYSHDRQIYPDRKFIGTESISMAGTRSDYNWMFDRPTTPPAKPGHYQKPPASNNKLDVEQLWKFVRTHDYVTGDFMWTGIDYLGESSWPNKLATFGTLDTCGFKKDGYYFYQSQWTDKPVLHLMPHWNLKGREGQIIPVTCYTNCETVELFLNGKSFGVKGYEFPLDGMQKSYGIYPPRAYLARTTSDLHLSWDVPYEPGTIKAVGTFKGQSVTEEVVTAGQPAAIKLSVDKSAISNDGCDVLHVTCEVVDAHGNLVPTADNDIHFKLTGPARLLSVDNGNPSSDESFKADHRRAFSGMALAILQSTLSEGSFTIEATSVGLSTGKVSVKAVREH